MKLIIYFLILHLHFAVISFFAAWDRSYKKKKSRERSDNVKDFVITVESYHDSLFWFRNFHQLIDLDNSVSNTFVKIYQQNSSNNLPISIIGWILLIYVNFYFTLLLSKFETDKINRTETNI